MDRFDFCRALARDAGKVAAASFGRSTAALKGRHDVVTQADGDVEQLIRNAIAARYPGDAIIGEEHGGTPGERVWIIDPIDGTANFARGIPQWCVSIGYVERGEPVAGAIYEPAVDRLYSAARGEGAWCDAARIRVSEVATLTAATVECGWSLRRSNREYLALVERFLGAGCAFRRAGSGALGLADVAAGRTEGYCELHINAWDCAAGLLLVTEAGGRTNDFFAGDALAAGNAVMATNAALACELAAVAGIEVGFGGRSR